jgi:arylsulfatase A-like enzyme
MVEEMDISVGEIINTLKEEGILENTVIFFAGDNGYSQYGLFGRVPWQDDPIFKNKGPWPQGKFSSTHEGGLQVPFFVYWKGKIEPGVSYHICALYDFPATAADIAGVKPPRTDGISLYPTITGKKKLQQEHDFYYWENGSHSNHAQSVRFGKWWAYRPAPSEPVELYDLTSDMGCTRNLAGSNPEVIFQIKEIMTREHRDSEWYVNPGESKEQSEEKRQNAIAEGSLQNGRLGNGLQQITRIP